MASNPTSGNISKETRNTNSKEYLNPSVHCSFIYNTHQAKTVTVPLKIRNKARVLTFTSYSTQDWKSEPHQSDKKK